MHGSDPRAYSVTAERFTSDAGNRVSHTRLVDVAWDAGRPQPVNGSERALPTQLVLLSMGFLGPEDRLLDHLRLERDERSNAAPSTASSTPACPACSPPATYGAAPAWSYGRSWRAVGRRASATAT